MQFIKSRIFYCKSRENSYQYYKSHENLQVMRAASERAMKSKGLYDKIIITIAPSYTGKEYHSFVAVGIVTRAVHS